MVSSIGSLASAPSRRLWWTMFALLCVLYALTATYTRMQSIDTFNTSLQAYQLAVTGSPVVGEVDDLLERQVVEGRHGLVTNRLPGSVGLGVMAYTLARPALPGSIDTTADLPLWPTALASAAAVAAAVATLGVGLRRMDGIDPRWALGATMVLALGTATWSVSADAPWTHTVTQLGLAVAITGFVAERSWAAGVGFAVAILARTHTALIAAAAGIGRAVPRRELRPLVVIGALSVVGLAAAMLYGVWLYGGGPSVSVGYADYSDRVVGGGTSGSALSTVGNVLLLFVHPVRGLLPTTPVLVPLLWALPAAWRNAPGWVRGLAIGATIQLVVQGLVNPYTGGDAFFGSRLTIEFLTATVPLWLLAYAHGRGRVREWTHAAAAVSVIIHMAGATVLHLGMST